jgi:acetyl-CoA C-acetyltransferase
MLYEMVLQLQGRAGPRQLKNPSIGLTHNLGGQPSQNVCSISIVGLRGSMTTPPPRSTRWSSAPAPAA